MSHFWGALHSMFVESRGPIPLPQRGSMFVERAIRYIYLREALVPIKTSKKCGRYSLTRYLSVSYTVSGLRLGSSPSEPQARTVNCLHVIFARRALKMYKSPLDLHFYLFNYIFKTARQ